MVRTYVRKTQRGTQYTKEDLANALLEVQNNNMSLHRAHRFYNIPKATLYTHVHS